MSFEQLKNKADQAWEKWENAKVPRIMVGASTCGNAAGALETLAAIGDHLKKRNLKAEVTSVGCLGLCYLEPLVDIIMPGEPRITYGEANPARIRKLIDRYIIKGDPCPDLALGYHGDKPVDGIPSFWNHPMLKSQTRLSLRNSGHINPVNLNHYIHKGGFLGLKKALNMTPEEVISEIKDSGLRGRSGGGFPTGTKWSFCLREKATPKYFICNAHEGDPDTYVDRGLMEGDPYAVLEGMAIGAYAIQASCGFIYIDHDYQLAIRLLDKAIMQMGQNGLIGDDILGSGFNFHVEIKRGAGAFVCGEEGALIASMEGKRGMPSHRPPFPAQKGYMNKPTIINNVETLVNAARIMEKGADSFRKTGTGDSPGTKLFALSGNINRPGLIEVPMGTSLERIIEDIGGGIENNGKFKSAQLAGSSGGCIPAELADLRLDYEHPAVAGTMLGSGGLVVMDDGACMVDIARFLTAFSQHESCGKCVPCRLGARQMFTILNDICSGNGRQGDIELLLELGNATKRASLCGLGQAAGNPVLTTIKYFREEYEEHISRRYCRAGVCRDIAGGIADSHALTKTARTNA